MSPFVKELRRVELNDGLETKASYTVKMPGRTPKLTPAGRLAKHRKATGKAGLLPVIPLRDSRPRTPWEASQIIVLLRRLLHWAEIGLRRR